jgi:hypothetical protein
MDLLDVNDTRFALVEWKGENGSLSVVSMTKFVKINKEYELEKFYKVIWPVDNKKYMAKLLLIG